MSTFEFSKKIFLLHMEENAYKFQLTTLTIPNLWLSSKLVRIFPSHFNSVHCFWFFNMLGPRRIFSFISFLNPHFLCSSTKRKKGKKLKIIPIFQKSRKIETDTKTLWQYELCNDHQIKVVIHTIYAIYREMKNERKTNYFAKNTKKNPIKKLEKKTEVQERRNLCTF